MTSLTWDTKLTCELFIFANLLGVLIVGEHCHILTPHHTVMCAMYTPVVGAALF